MLSIREFLNYWAGADNELLRWCPHHETQKYATLGTLVMMTGTFASLAAGFAFFTVFESLLTAAILGLLWGFTIINIDRLLLSTFPKTKGLLQQVLHALPRIILAMFIGLTVAHPLTLRLFEAEIISAIQEKSDADIARLNTSEAEALATVEQQKKDALNNLPEAIIERRASDDKKKLEEDLRKCEDERYRAEIAAQQELDGIIGSDAKGTIGSGVKGAGPSFSRKKAAAADLATRCDALNGHLTEKEKAILVAERDAETPQAAVNKKWADVSTKTINGTAASIDHIKARKTSFLRRSETLGTIAEKNRHAGSACIAVMLLFIFVELTPVFLKIISPQDSVDRLAAAVQSDFADTKLHQILPAVMAFESPPKSRSAASTPGGEDQAVNVHRSVIPEFGGSRRTLALIVIATMLLTAGSLMARLPTNDAIAVGGLFLTMAIPFTHTRERRLPE